MKGRKPKPTALQMAQGDPRKKGMGKLAEKLAAEPHPTRGLPGCPRYLKGRARSAWTFWAAELADMQIDRRPDAQMLQGACVNYAKAVQADLILEKDGLLVTETFVSPVTGEVLTTKIKRHPADLISNSAWRQVRAFCSEFGLSPVSRTRLSIVEAKDSAIDDLAKILSRPREPKPKPSETVQ
jgi:P27 family predicted phage terminase small subunit